MKLNGLKLIVGLLIPAAMVMFTACSSTPSSKGETTSAAAIQQGVPGGLFVETHAITAKVSAVNAAKRTVTLVTPDGKKTTVKCGPEVVNFDQIRTGDQLKVTVTEELAVQMATNALTGEGAAEVVLLAPKGAKPAGVVAQTVQVTATVTAIDLKKHKATLQFSDGTTKTVAVREDVDLTQRKVGEKVVIRITEAVALSMEKP
jgi:hypothetical protein